MARRASAAIDPPRSAGDGVWVPPVVDLSVPSVSRMYDYLLGGKDNFGVDRAAVAKIIEVAPQAQSYAAANRAFALDAVTVMAKAGIDQFIDFGAGLPTSPSVHDIARKVNPQAVVAYLDIDPVVLVHNRALLAGNPGVVCLQHDLRQPQAVIDDPQLRQVIDFRRPVGLLFSAVLHFVRHDRAPDIIASYTAAVPSGSMLAISAVCREGLSPQVVSRIEGQFLQTNVGVTFRTRAQIEELFDGHLMIEPGLVTLTGWQGSEEGGGGHGALCGVGRKS